MTHNEQHLIDIIRDLHKIIKIMAKGTEQEALIVTNLEGQMKLLLDILCD